MAHFVYELEKAAFGDQMIRWQISRFFYSWGLRGGSWMVFKEPFPFLRQKSYFQKCGWWRQRTDRHFSCSSSSLVCCAKVVQEDWNSLWIVICRLFASLRELIQIECCDRRKNWRVEVQLTITQLKRIELSEVLNGEQPPRHQHSKANGCCSILEQWNDRFWVHSIIFRFWIY